MNTRFTKLVITGVVAGAVALGGLGLVAAQTPGGSGMGAGGMSGGMGGGAAMMAGQAMHGMMGAQHTQMQAAVAAALGISVEDLQAQLTAGKTVADIARERGVDLTAVQAAMQTAHQTDGMPGMGQGRHMDGAGEPGDCSVDGN